MFCLICSSSRKLFFNGSGQVDPNRFEADHRFRSLDPIDKQTLATLRLKPMIFVGLLDSLTAPTPTLKTGQIETLEPTA
jgi:hypothetical protein